jgi:hypothetical protein
MLMPTILSIDNSFDAAVKSGKWKNPGASLYDKLLDAIMKDNSDATKQLLEEVYLVAPTGNIKNSPHGRTPFSRSGCKYPHHSIRDGKVVVNISGLKAAYSRAKQAGIFKGEVKEHLVRHYKEMGIYEGSTMESDQIIEENFDDIIQYLCESNKDLKKAVEEDKRAEREITRVKGEKDDELVPIYGIAKKYSRSKYLNDKKTLKDEYALKQIEHAKNISFFTRGDNYTHALVSFDDSLEDMLTYQHDGFAHDSINDEMLWNGTDSIYICVMFVPKKDRDRMKAFVKKLDKSKTKYASVNVLKAYIGRPYKTDNRFVCSSFTGYIMQCANPKNLHRDFSRLRPEDMTILPRAFYVMNVKDRDDFLKKRGQIKSKVAAIWNEYKDEIEEYNNQLPKMMLINRMDKYKTIDKFFDWLFLGKT